MALQVCWVLGLHHDAEPRPCSWAMSKRALGVATNGWLQRPRQGGGAKHKFSRLGAVAREDGLLRL
ncbi:hypothetical protein FH972_023356 [Carpinus fangiana]|uniref:Uncharacterized protein n=1 Tax=Carpinus fangiana TaxID=176857 RepID=A0A5N6KV81_9ROSI|nr:hypothetical protein FH972_023356 [Carpinus fangiana]